MVMLSIVTPPSASTDDALTAPLNVPVVVSTAVNNYIVQVSSSMASYVISI